ncbi:hypothetical protein DFS34DRAFT_365460 [Phlyctochytrium arcticum]|nr:hypothetical protein DFS34DRAFT_365460 [Phlyctochytrium arcticum]
MQAIAKEKKIAKLAAKWQASVVKGPASQRPAAVLAAYLNEIQKSEDLSVQEPLQLCKFYQNQLKSATPNTDSDLDSDATEADNSDFESDATVADKQSTLLRIQAELGTFSADIWKVYLDTTLFLLLRAKNLQVWAISDLQRSFSRIAYACFITAPNYDQNKYITPMLLQEFKDRNVPLVTINCDGDSHALGLKGVGVSQDSRPEAVFITQLWRDEMTSLQGKTRAVLLASMLEELPHYLLASNADRGKD